MGWNIFERKRAVRARVITLVKERKREKLAILADELGYSYHYFKYSILPSILAKIECIEHDRVTDELVWVCEDIIEAGPVVGVEGSVEG